MKRNSIWFAVVIVMVVACAHRVSAQWTNTNGPANEHISDLAVCNNTIFAGTFHGIYVSSDTGNTWNTAISGLTNDSIKGFMVSGNSIFAIGLEGGLFLSTNNGGNWVPLSSGFTEKKKWCLTMSNGKLIAGTVYGGIFLSSDTGKTWGAANSGLAGKFVMDFAVGDGNIFAAVDGGVFLSTDNGANWSPTAMKFTPEVLSVCKNVVYAGTLGGPSIYRSADNGGSWKQLSRDGTNSTRALAVCDDKVFIGAEIDGIFCVTNSDTKCRKFYPSLPSFSSIWSIVVCGNNVFTAVDSKTVWRMSLSDFVGVIGQKPTPRQTEASMRLIRNSNCKASFGFSLPRSDHVVLKIYDPYGREQTTLVDGQFDSGMHAAAWDARGLAAGCYTAWMRTGSTYCAKSFMISR
jgi:photosystem II stability/assembly factor-like uncharacterized protein